MILRTTATLSGLAILSACGGSGTSFDTVPLGAAGFATDERKIGGPYDWRLAGTQRTLLDSERNVSQSRASDLALVGTVNEGPITLVLDGKTYILDRSDENEVRYEDGDDFIELFTALPVLESVGALELFSKIDGGYDTGMFVVGYDTNPAQVAELAGTATFDGTAKVTFRRGFDGAFGMGDVMFAVNFDSNSIRGDGTLTDSELDIADFNFTDLTIVFEDTDLTENSFSGAFVVSFPGSDLDLNDTIYEGRLFGEDAQEIGGQFHGRIGEEDGTYIDGVFVGSQ